MRHVYLSILFIGFFYISNAQPSRDWDKTYGGSNWEELHVIVPTKDGGFLIGGNLTAGIGSDITEPIYGGNDMWLVKTDQNGQKLWDKVYGGNKEDKLWAIQPLPGGGYMLGGTSDSDISGNKSTANIGQEDFWLVRIDENGQKIWEKTIGGYQEDQLFVLNLFNDTTLLVAGYTNSGIGGDKTTDSLGVYDAWVMKVGLDGHIKWQQTLGGNYLDNIYDATPTADGGFLLGGASASGISPTKSQHSRGFADYWIIKIDTDGFQEWDRRYGGNDVDQLQQILPLKDGNYLLLGASKSNATFDHTAPNRGSFDYWALKIDREGKVLWDNTYGGSKFDGATKAVETQSGHFFIGGTSDSPISGTKSSANFGGYDYWLIYLDKDGTQVWDKSYGGSKFDAMTSLLQSPNGSLMMGGHSESPKSAFKSDESKGYNDFWLIKTWCGVEIDLPTDTTICQGLPLSYIAYPQNCAGGNCDILWSDGLKIRQNAFQTDVTKQLGVFVEDRNGCWDTDTLHINVLPIPNLDLGKDTTLFEDETVTIDLSDMDAVLEWENGDGSPIRNITASGSYAVTVTMSNGCTAKDEVNVCLCDKRLLYIPNVFQPDEDIYNDTWYVQSKPGAIAELEVIEIYDRWGHRVFKAERAQPNEKAFGWNGIDNGSRSLPGVYTYAIRARYTDQLTKTIFGTVTLIR